jgi:hypothetical protein
LNVGNEGTVCFTLHLETGTQHLETGTQHLETGTQHLETGTQHLETGTQHLETGTQLNHTKSFDFTLPRRAFSRMAPTR